MRLILNDSSACILQFFNLSLCSKRKDNSALTAFSLHLTLTLEVLVLVFLLFMMTLAVYLKDKKEFLNFRVTRFVFRVCINKIDAYFFLIIEKTGKIGKRNFFTSNFSN